MAEDLPTIHAKLKDKDQGVYVIPYVPPATTTEAGVVMYDGTTVTKDANGKLSVNGMVELKDDVEQLKTTVLTKQDALAAGDNITIDANNVISATDTTYTAGSNIAISQNNEISATYRAGTGISISDAGVISTVPYVPPNVYTTDNLTADKNVSITTKSAGPGGIDEHTIACWHFDGDAIDIVHGNEIQGINTFSSLPGEYKFGGQAAKVNAEYLPYGEEYTKYQLSTPITLGDTFTIDFWIHSYVSGSSYPYYDGFCNFAYELDNDTYYIRAGQSISSIRIPHYSDNISGTYVLDTKLHHVAVVNNQGNIRCYYDGKDMTFGLTNGHQVSGLTIENLFFASSTSNTYVWLDELRISDVARWTENFEVPTSQYTSSEYADPTYEIDTAHEFLSQDNLISNQNIRIITKPAEGGIDEHTLALYDFEEQDYTNTGTGVLYYNPSVKQFDSFTSQYTKFGTYSLLPGSSSYGYSTITPYATPQDKPFTYDCWCLSIGNRYTIASLRCYPNTGSSERYISLYSYYGELTFSGPSGDNYVIGAVSANTWHHYGICYDNGMHTITIFVDGILIYTYQVPQSVTHFNSIRVLFPGDGGNTYWDEARFSDIVRYTDDFTPPTQAYTTATGPTNYSFDTTVNLDTLATKEDALRKSALVGGKGITLVDGKKNYSVAGSLLFNFDEVWGFSDSNYIYHENVIKNALNSFKIFTAFKLNNAVADQGIFDSKTHIGLRLTTTANNNLRLRVSADGSSSYVVDINGSKVLNPDQKMYACIEYNSTTGYRLLVKGPSDADWTEEATSSVTTVPFIETENHVLGINSTSSGHYLNGYIYLADTWVEVDGEKAWVPYSDTVIIDADIVTSIDSQSTDEQVPSAKCVYDIVGNIESALQAIRGVQQ